MGGDVRAARARPAARASRTCSPTSPAGSPAPRASASGSPPTRSGCNAPLWIDAEDFDPAEHIHRSAAEDLPQLADAVLSEPLRRDRPLWEFWIADRLRDGRIGLVGKAHHCMVDGLAAVELGSLLLDPAPRPEPPAEDAHHWLPAPTPHALELVARGAWDLTREQLGLLRHPLALARSPLAIPAFGLRTARALAGAVLPVAPASRLNEPGSPERHLATARRPLSELRAIKEAHGVTVNDVLLAAVAGALRRHAERAEERPRDLKAMVPVNVRSGDDGGEFGNRITFMFVELPASVADPFVRLQLIGDATRVAQGVGRARGRRRRAQGAVLRAAAGAEGGRPRARQPARLQPRRLQHPRPARSRCTWPAAGCTTPTRWCRCRRATRCRSA